MVQSYLREIFSYSQQGIFVLYLMALEKILFSTLIHKWGKDAVLGCGGGDKLGETWGYHILQDRDEYVVTEDDTDAEQLLWAQEANVLPCLDFSGTSF